MPIKGGRGFFHAQAFMKDKEFSLIQKRDWKDFNTKVHVGVCFDVGITVDNTEYRRADGSLIGIGLNRFEKLTFKVKSKNVEDFNIPQGAQVVPVNPRCTLYGDRMDQLSIVCDDVVVVQKAPKN